jgi:putative membrane protein
MRPAIDAVLAAWHLPLWTCAFLSLTTALYLLGFGRMHRQMPARFTMRRLAYYLSGVAALAIALVSPLAALDDRLLITHMMQHLLLLLIAPPLLLLGAPQIPLVRAIPPFIAKRTIGVIARSRVCRRSVNLLLHPAGAFLLFSVAMLGWHLPGPFQLALRSGYWHALEHGCFIVTGMIFWYPIVCPWPAVERWSRWAFVPYLLMADAENSVLAAFMVFSGRLLYPFYADVPRIGGISPITDQIVAGAIMWVPGSILFLVPAVVIVMRALEPQELTRLPQSPALTAQAIPHQRTYPG